MAAMLAADADLEVRLGLASFGNGQLHQFADALLVQHLEGVVLQDAGLDIGRQELVLGVLAAEGEGGLGQVVGAEGEELGVSAMRPARRQARTTSSMLPNLTSTLMPWVSSTTLCRRCT
jgi:hypothetical protein